MYLFRILAEPDPDNEEVDRDVAGAYVNVWIDFPEPDAAEVIARYYIKDAGWVPITTEETTWVEETDYNEGDESREYFLEALVNGSCRVFYTWSKDESEPEIIEGNNEIQS